MRVLALRLWLVVVRGEVGDHTGACCTSAVGICLCGNCSAVHCHGFCNAVFVPIRAAAALSAYGGGSGFVHDAVKAFHHRDTEKPTSEPSVLIEIAKFSRCPGAPVVKRFRK